jgi:uncharacterized protein (DUF1697 family)
MESYLAILRGINVGGQRKIAMADLKQLFEANGFANVTTYIQSGNVAFRAEKQSDAALARRLEALLETRFGFDVAVVVRTAAELRAVVDGNPFLQEPDVDVDKLHVTFLAQAPAADLLAKIAETAYLPDRFKIVDRDVYLYIPGGYGNTKLANNFFENKLKVKGTTRNWKTVNKLAELAE